MVNKAILEGYVGKDPDIRTMNNGSKIATFSLATSQNWKDKASGERKSKTEWHRIVVFSGTLIDSVIAPYIKKGSHIYVEGHITTREWEDSKAIPGYSIKRHTTEINIKMGGNIVLLDNKGDNGYSAPAPAPDVTEYDLDDEIPF